MIETLDIGTAVLTGSLSALLGPAGFFLAARFHYVPFEEARMRETFGEDYDAYARRVRRWI
jgi:protein-S-isoprenylcysteine O-methyltransferase Ste14